MDVKKAIEKRRSIRKYLDKDVPDDLIDELIDAARMAPTGNNSQPCRFMIIKDKKTKLKLKDNNMFPQDFVYEAPVLIVCTADPSAYKKIADIDDPNEKRALRDLSIASGFLVLRATELGLSTCYIGWVKKEEIKELLGIPKEFVLPYVITVGYSDEEPGKKQLKTRDEILL